MRKIRNTHNFVDCDVSIPIAAVSAVMPELQNIYQASVVMFFWIVCLTKF